MNIRQTILAAAIAALALTAPAIANPVIAGIPATQNGPPSGPPMQIESCILHPASDVGTGAIAVGTALAVRATRSPFLQDVEIGGGVLMGMAAQRPYLSIRMTNEGAVPISIVRIFVRAADGSTGFVRDAGVFSPGVTIHHEFFSGAGTTGGNSFWSQPAGLSCGIDFIVYRNGTVWHSTTH